MLDLIVRNATLPDGRRGLDIAVKDGRIAEIAPARMRPPSKYWPRYISCHSRPIGMGSRPIRNCA